MSERPVLYLIDGHALAYRQHYAMIRGGFSTRTGEPTNAVYGFAQILIRILQDDAPHYLAISFDKGLSGREDLYPDYKGTRASMPEDLVTQMERIYDLVRAFNIPILELEGCEADDVIGTVVGQAEAQGVDVLILTGDRDILQLLSPHVRVRLPAAQGADKDYDEAAFMERYQLHSHQLVDLKALMGDSSDNIPGVAGVGEKTATQLLQEYDDLDSIYAHLDDIKPRVRDKLVQGKEMAYISRELATIKRDLPITLDIEACAAQDFDPALVDQLFGELEFGNLRERFQQAHSESNIIPLAHEVIETQVVQDEAGLQALVNTLESAKAIVWDVETTGVDQMACDLVGIALAVDGETGYYIPVGHRAAGAGTMFEEAAVKQLPLKKVIEALRGPLTDANIPKYAHNASFDLVVMRRYGIDVSPITFDSMIAEWVRDPVSKLLGLKRFALQELNVSMTDIESLIGTGKKQITMADVDIESAAPYAAADAAVTWRAVETLRGKLKQESLEKLFDEMEMPLVPVIADMEQAGVRLDRDFLAEMSTRLQQVMNDLEQRIIALAGGSSFNIGSPKQLSDVLFTKLGLPVEGLKKTSHGYSTDVNTLEALRDQHEIIPQIMEYRELSKLKGTYVDALPSLINPQTGRLHTSYNQTGTSTGRFSSSNPNLQNIPIRTDLGREVRRAFVADSGKLLLAVDYSQIELRVMAHISGDETLIEAFRQGQDIHQATAAAVFAIEPEAVSYAQRSFAKRVNFGLMYGMGAFRLARDSELTLAEADSFIKTYFERLPGVDRYMKETRQLALQQGYVETLLGRKRHFPNLTAGSENSQRAQGELRAAINMPIQGTAADILKLAMLHLHQALRERDLPARMILQVHDELVLEVDEAAIEQVAGLVVEVMEQAYPMVVPLVANAEYGPNWLEMVAI